MDWEEVETFWLAITKIEAQALLNQLKVSDYPNLKQKARGDLHSGLYRQAFPEQTGNTTPQGLAAFL